MPTRSDKLKTASVLAFERKLDPSDGQMYSGRWESRDSVESWTPVSIREKSVRGTISNRLSARDQDPAKLDAAIENPNLQTVDVASLPAESDTLRVVFTLKILGGAGVPSACNSEDYRARIAEVVSSYASEVGFHTLARRYAHNLANARFLWRNRMGAEQVEVVVEDLVSGVAARSWRFNALETPLRSFDVPSHVEGALDELSERIETGLRGAGFVLLRITAFARLGDGQEIFPSQELILDKSQSKKSKTLYEVGGVAGLHSQKIGNAIRTIDTWYSDSDDVQPIAVEPYGSVTTLGHAFRAPREKKDFYTLLDSWVIADKVPELGQQHFVMATLVRGGVFGEAKGE